MAQPDIIGASSVVPSPSTEAAIEKVVHLLCCPFCDKLSQNFLIEFFLVHRYSIFKPEAILSIMRNILMRMRSDRQLLLLAKPCRKRPEIS